MSFFIRYFFLFVISVLPLELFAVCLHPLEELALLHGKPKHTSLKTQMEQTRKQLDALEERVEKLEDKIGEIKIDLKNSLDDSHFTTQKVKKAYNEAYPKTPPRTDEKINNLGSEIKDSAISSISGYMEGQDDSWDKAGMPWYHDEDHETANSVAEYFKRNGQITERKFCDKYATSSTKRDCIKSIKNLERYYKELSRLVKIGEEKEEFYSRLEDEQFDRDIGLSDEEDTEANPLCFECLDELRELDKPTTGQVVGNILSVVAGGALSYYGYRAGKREARTLNDLRIRQGYDPTGSGGLSWAGASLGLPFIANGVYGLVGGNSQFGSYACHPGMFGGAAQAYGPFSYGGFPGGYGGFSGAYGGFPGGYGGFPGAYGGIQFGGFPGGYGGFPGAYGGIQFGGFPGGYGGFPGGYGGFPGAYGGIQFGGFPGGYGGFPGAYGGIQFGGFPGGYGGFPGAYGGIQFGGFPGAYGGIQFGGVPGGYGGVPGGYGGFPGAYGGIQFGGVPGIPGAGAMYQQQQYAQYLQYQQQQMQAQMQAQQAWMQHQISLQQDWMQREQVVGSLTQELYNIQRQIYLVRSGGTTSGLISPGTGLTGFPPGYVGGNLGGGPTHNPAPNPNPGSSGDVPFGPGR